MDIPIKVKTGSLFLTSNNYCKCCWLHLQRPINHLDHCVVHSKCVLLAERYLNSRILTLEPKLCPNSCAKVTWDTAEGTELP